MQTRELWLQDEVKSGALEIRPIGSLDNLADLFTKSFARARHEALCELVGLQHAERADNVR
eukprot:2057821-Heterocapsa_arctica.AAC.1